METNVKERIQLFGPKRVSSPYNQTSSLNRPDFSESQLSSLESQNDEEMSTMFTKIKSLKSLSEKMGVEINSSNSLINDVNDQFGQLQGTLKKTWNKMLIMAKRSGISWKVWLGVFGVVILMFFIVWF
ncbi:hypothetical protein WICPIJ_004677 [Wickerhamomyces pijperi]|uniref:t-SNARE coiled-coil homology domain-containing protein n=1 Tax=Wickerhamomyces pijperi TaxID=599730 RepID=A0A9P8TMN6_WICPI|nr:hypothetical protein WICPIJ_004677 [Wickerhamomyces pijperi]